MGVSQEILFCTFLKKPPRKDVHITESCFTHNNRAYEVGSSIGIFNTGLAIARPVFWKPGCTRVSEATKGLTFQIASPYPQKLSR